MKRTFSIFLSIIMLISFAFLTSAVSYAKSEKPKATYITGTYLLMVVLRLNIKLMTA